MNNTGNIIAGLRKEAGFTQEQLANMIGVSAQTVSKWETGITMPDIMLLPIIADVFDTDIDYLFGREDKAKQSKIAKENVHEAAYDAVLELLQRFFYSTGADPEISEAELKKRALEKRERIKNEPSTQTMVLSNVEGNGVFVDRDIALCFNKNKNEIEGLFDDEAAWSVIKRFADGRTREVYKFILDNRGRSFTASFIAAKCGIEIQLAERALDNLLRMSLISRNDVDSDDGIIYVYSAWGTHKLLLVYSMLSIASRLGNYVESYRGFMG